MKNSLKLPPRVSSEQGCGISGDI